MVPPPVAGCVARHLLKRCVKLRIVKDLECLFLLIRLLLKTRYGRFLSVACTPPRGSIAMTERIGVRPWRSVHLLVLRQAPAGAAAALFVATAVLEPGVDGRRVVGIVGEIEEVVGRYLGLGAGLLLSVDSLLVGVGEAMGMGVVDTGAGALPRRVGLGTPRWYADAEVLDARRGSVNDALLQATAYWQMNSLCFRGMAHTNMNLRLHPGLGHG